MIRDTYSIIQNLIRTHVRNFQNMNVIMKKYRHNAKKIQRYNSIFYVLMNQSI